MGRREEYRTGLRGLARDAWAGYLTAHSGLPGPRANLELVQAVADEGDGALFDHLIATDDEYLSVCGIVGLGRLISEHAGGGSVIEARLRRHAADSRWRVREAVAMALQRLGDADLPRLRRLVDDWAGRPDPLVQRAAAAALCEPRLLRAPDAAAHAVALCDRLTASLAARPAAERRAERVRVLRQALGYCWSVAVAADPAHGLPAFRALDGYDDADVRWIVRENAKKSRLAKLL